MRQSYSGFAWHFLALSALAPNHSRNKSGMVQHLFMDKRKKLDPYMHVQYPLVLGAFAAVSKTKRGVQNKIEGRDTRL
jgi:hypothetical protein